MKGNDIMKDIIKILQQNARISNAELGEILGISAEAAAAEIEKLEKSGVIKGYSVIVDDDIYDKSTVYATIELKVTPQRDCGFDDIAKTIMMYDEVESVSLMSSGAYDLAVEVKGNDLKDVAFFVSERLATIDGILSTSTHFILKKYKEKGIFIDREEPDERGLG
jgi:DNA-binding Lrp family transcriptional regulator